jgi:hypothetical protein
MSVFFAPSAFQPVPARHLLLLVRFTCIPLLGILLLVPAAAAQTLVEFEDSNSLLAKEEIFAPVSALLRASSAEEAVGITNEVRYGLAAAVFTEDLEEAMSIGNRLEAGLVRVNASTAGVDYHAGGTPEQQIPHPNPNPIDVQGHGTNVADIIAGVAPAGPGSAGGASLCVG